MFKSIVQLFLNTFNLCIRGIAFLIRARVGKDSNRLLYSPCQCQPRQRVLAMMLTVLLNSVHPSNMFNHPTQVWRTPQQRLDPRGFQAFRHIDQVVNAFLEF